MKSVYDTIMKLREASGSNEKKSILNSQKSNSNLKLFLYRVYEPTISYYQTKIEKGVRSPLFDDSDREFDVDLLDEIYETLAERQLTGHAAIKWLSDLYGDLKEDWMRELLEMLIDGDIKAGIKSKTINKTWPDLITMPPYMRCTLPKKIKLEDWPWEDGIDSEIKYDGMYGDVHIHLTDDSKSFVSSRKGSIYPKERFAEIIKSCKEVAKDIIENLKFEGEEFFVFNGELEMLDKAGKLMNRAEGNGKFNSLLQGEQIDEFTPQYKIWDFQPGSARKARKFDMPRRKRKDALALSFIFPKPGIELAYIKTVHSYDEAQAEFKRVRKLGLEGTIVKHPEGPWCDGTSKYQAKLKGEVEIDLKIIRMNKGSGKNAHLFGSLGCVSSDDLLEVDVTGFSDELREEIHNNWSYFEGKIMTVLCNDLQEPSKDNKKWSVFLPRHHEIRNDKTEADSLKRIKEIFASVINDEKEDDA